MLYRLLADFTVLLHFVFILFVVCGGLFVIQWRKVVWLHLPAVVWAAWIEFSGGICPLTYLENWLLVKSGSGGYHGDFIANFLMPVVYPANITRKIQVMLAVSVITINLLIYGCVFMIKKK